jgi:metal-responsive CopG/Arc/MetJ family transcriptional regulator
MISMRMPADLLAELDSRAEYEQRSRAQLIELLLRSLITTGTLPTLRSDRLARIPDFTSVAQAQAHSQRCNQTGHTGFQRADGYWCSTCRRMYP